MVAPGAVVGDVHALLAPAVTRGDRAVGIDEGFLEELLGLLLPDPQPGLVADVHQRLDIALGEAAAEVAGGGRVGDALGPQGIEEHLVVASGFNVLQAVAAGQEVVGDIQDVITLVIRQMPLQEVEVPVDVLDQSDLAGQEVDGPEATGGNATDLLGDLIVDVRGGHHRLGMFDAGLVLQAAKDSPLATVQLVMDTGVHSKTSWRRMDEASQAPRLFAKTRGFRAFRPQRVWGYAWLRVKFRPRRPVLVRGGGPMAATIRVGAVSYLNAKPLYYRLGEFAPGVALEMDLPSRLADRLAAGELDLALIPSIEYLRGAGRGYEILPGFAIAARGAVRSVKLFSRVPPERIERLALDSGSRTSQALAQVWLDARFGVRPRRI